MCVCVCVCVSIHILTSLLRFVMVTLHPNIIYIYTYIYTHTHTYDLLVEVGDGNIVCEHETPILRHARLRNLVYVCVWRGGERGAGKAKDRESKSKSC
jgi:hypothetical protein